MIFDQDALFAAIGLVKRSGGASFELGYLHDDVPIEEAGWWAAVHFRGARLTVENEKGPVQAAEALARRLLDGALCRRCGKPIRLGDGEGCRWTRQGVEWVPGCGKEIDPAIPLEPYQRGR